MPTLMRFLSKDEPFLSSAAVFKFDRKLTCFDSSLATYTLSLLLFNAFVACGCGLF
jgi:hypothetical protein